MPLPLYHRDLGGAGRVPLVILHGMLGSSRNWQTAGRDLAEHFHVLAPDARNHGASPHAAGMDYADMVEDVLVWLDAQGLARVTLLGHSMGGKTAMLLACKHSARVERLIIVDMAPKDYFWPAHQEEFAAMNELDLGTLHSRAEAEQRLERRVGNWAMRKFLATNLECDSTRRWRWSVNLPALTAALPTLEKNPLQAGDLYHGPAHFIAGGKSAYITAGDELAIHQHFPAAQLVVMPDCGHNPHIEARGEFVATVLGLV